MCRTHNGPREFAAGLGQKHQVKFAQNLCKALWDAHVPFQNLKINVEYVWYTMVRGSFSYRRQRLIF
jgi:hypothetical protein